jgi:hypothetical protein
MNLFKKSIAKYTYYQNRDLIYKCSIDNIYEIPKITNSIVIQKKEKLEDIFPYISSLILLLDKIPFLLQIKRSPDKKVIGTVIGAKVLLNLEETISFLLRIKNEGSQHDYLSKDLNSNVYVFKMNIFDEFLGLYEKYSMLQDFSLTLHYKNCKNEKERYLLVSNLINA